MEASLDHDGVFGLRTRVYARWGHPGGPILAGIDFSETKHNDLVGADHD